jgi:hypothetical protein
MLRATGCFVFAAFTTVFFTTTGLAAEGNWIETFIDANGGCGQHRLLFNHLGNVRTDVRRNGGIDWDVFGKPAIEWSDQNIDDAVNVYKKCEARLGARQKNRCMANGYDEKHCDRGPDPVTLKMAQGYERDLREIVSLVRERDSMGKRQSAAQQAQNAAADLRKQKVAEDEARRDQEKLLEQAVRDKEAAAAASKLADTEEPKIAEAARQAAEARKVREAAEGRLAEVRGRLNAGATANRTAADQAQAANALRDQALRQKADQEADARLSRECRVTLEQFNQVRFGMQLQQVDRLFGCKGRETSGTRISGYGTLSTYAWDGNADLSVVTATFKGTSLQSKAQIGLK